MNTEQQKVLSKVPEVTLIFWIIKILATTLGETGGDAVSMSMNLGYLVGTEIFAAIFIFCGNCTNFREKVPSSHLLDNHYRNNNGWNDFGRLRGSFSWYRLFGRNGNTVHIAYGITSHLVSRAWFGSSRHREFT